MNPYMASFEARSAELRAEFFSQIENAAHKKVMEARRAAKRYLATARPSKSKRATEAPGRYARKPERNAGR